MNDATLSNVCCIANMTVVGNRLAFTGNSFAYGSELWMGSVICRSTEDNSVPNVLKSTEDVKSLTTIYPNPANNILSVRVASSVESRITITVIDVNGAPLITRMLGSGETITQINISNLAAGVYFVKIISSNSSENTVKKFVKL